MRVRILSQGHDWTFGRSQQEYIIDSKAVSQNVKTRILCWKNDDYMNTQYGIDYRSIFSSHNKLDLLKREVLRVVSTTNGVVKVTSLSINETGNRTALVQFSYIDIFNEKIESKVSI
jgi:hypothetical protein